MPIRNLHIIYFLGLMLLLFPIGNWAQTDTDSVLTIATQQIYENPDVSINIAEKILNDSKSTADVKVRTILIISTAYSSKREYEKSMEYALSAMDLLPKLQNENLKINLLHRIGSLYQELKIYEKSILYLDKALVAINKLPEDEDKFRSLGINNLLRGFVFRQQMSCDIALNYFEKGIEDYKKFPNTAGGNANISISYYSRGDCLIELGRIDEAESSFRQSIEYAKKADATSAMAFAQKGLAQVYTLKQQYLQAISLLNEALQNSENVGDKILNRDLYDALATNYIAVGDFKSYTLYKNKNISVHKQITKIERKTVDDSINDLIETNSRKIKTIENRSLGLQIGFSVVIFLFLFLMIRQIILSEKTLKSLLRRLKF